MEGIKWYSAGYDLLWVCKAWPIWPILISLYISGTCQCTFGSCLLIDWTVSYAFARLHQHTYWLLGVVLSSYHAWYSPYKMDALLAYLVLFFSPFLQSVQDPFPFFSFLKKRLFFIIPFVMTTYMVTSYNGLSLFISSSQTYVRKTSLKGSKIAIYSFILLTIQYSGIGLLVNLKRLWHF